MKTHDKTDALVSRREFLGSKVLLGLTGLGALFVSACSPTHNTARRTSRRVTRRTNRRINTLPRGYQTVAIGGATYYQASGSYWQRMGSGPNVYYVEVIVE